MSTRLWRAFPWNPRAASGQPFSPDYSPPQHGYNRFDLPRSERAVLYLAGSADHAVGELVQSYRNQTLDQDDLFIMGNQLALVEVTLEPPVDSRIADLREPEVLARMDTGPDQVAARERRTTQQVAEQLFADGWAGLRWWSAFFGEWHGTCSSIAWRTARYRTERPNPSALRAMLSRKRRDCWEFSLPRRALATQSSRSETGGFMLHTRPATLAGQAPSSMR